MPLDGDGDELQETVWSLFHLCLNLGLIASAMGQYPEHVREGFTEKLLMIREWADHQIDEVQSFGEAYDDGTEETN